MDDVLENEIGLQVAECRLEVWNVSFDDGRGVLKGHFAWSEEKKVALVWVKGVSGTTYCVVICDWC